MENNQNIQLAALLPDEKIETINSEVRSLFAHHYPVEEYSLIDNAVKLIDDLFNGRFPGYSACNTEYHDFHHTLEVFLASARLMDGYNIRNKEKYKIMTAVNILLAALFHDTGYIQESWDNSGTGAKHTQSHVERSMEFLNMHHYKFNIPIMDIACICRFILSTKMTEDFNAISFHSEKEKSAAALVASADLMGQMSNRAYLEKLLFLYNEYKEAEIFGYETEFDILKKSVAFYTKVEERLNRDLNEMFKYAEAHFSKRFNIKSNLYMLAIERQMDYLNTIIEDSTSNFRQKLNRADLETVTIVK
jgi:hypothetical protein